MQLKLNFFYFIPIAIFVVALVLRFYQFEGRFEWAGNQSLYSWELRQLTQGHLTLVGFDAAAIGGLRFPPFQLYMLAPFFLVSGGNPMSINLFLIILGAVTTLTFYFVGKSIFGERTALIAATIYAFSLNTITLDRKFNGSTFMIIISLLTIGLLYKILSSKEVKFWHFVILGSVIGLGFSMHYQSIFLLIAAVVVLFWQRKLRVFSRDFAIFVASVAFWLSPLLIFDLRHGFYNLRGIFLLQELYTYHGLSLAGFTQSAQYLIGNFFGIIFKPAYATNYQNFLDFPLIILIALGVIFFPLILKSKEKSNVILHLIVLLSFLGFLGLGFYQRGTYSFDYYYWFLIPGFVFVLAKAIGKFFEFRLAYLAIFALASYLFLNLWLFSRYKAPDSYKTFSEVAEALLIDSKQKENRDIVVQFKEIHPGQLDYIFFTQSKKLNVEPEKIVLIADNDFFIERTLTKSPPPVKILGKSAGANLEPRYLFEKSFTRRENLELIFESGKYKVYQLI